MKIKYLIVGALPVLFIGCGSGKCTNNGQVSIGSLPTGQSVMISSANIPVDGSKYTQTVGQITIDKLAINQEVRIDMSNPQTHPHLMFATKAINSKLQAGAYNPSSCVVTLQSPSCTIIADTTNAANGIYFTNNLVYSMSNPEATGTLNPIKYTISGAESRPVPPPEPSKGEIKATLSTQALAVGEILAINYTLTSAESLQSAIEVTANSSDHNVLSAYLGVDKCILTSETPTCTVFESALSIGSAYVSSIASGYTIADTSLINVNATPAPTPVLGNIQVALSKTTFDVGESTILTYTLESSQNVTTPVTIIATSSAESVLNFTGIPFCQVTTANPSCEIVAIGLTPGTTHISSAATGYTIGDTATINVTTPVPPLPSNAYVYFTNYYQHTVSVCKTSSNSNTISDCQDTGYTINNSSPSGIAVYGDYAYIVSGPNNSVVKCPIDLTDGKFSSCVFNTLPNSNQPFGITISNDYAYITNTAGNTITFCSIRSSDGELINCATANDSSYITSPYGITTSNGYLYAVNTGTSNIALFSIDNGTGNLTGIDFLTATPLSFAFPSSIAIDQQKAYVTNLINSKVFVCPISSSGGFLPSCFDSSGTFNEPVAISFKYNRAYVANSNLQTNVAINICEIANDGSFSSCTPSTLTGKSAFGIAFKDIP